jgi:hypothetical protein
MNRNVQWVGTCVHLPAHRLEAFDNSSREVTYRTFLKHVGLYIVRELNEQFGFHPTIKNDCHIQYYRGKWCGRPAMCMMHSSIHHIWLL